MMDTTASKLLRSFFFELLLLLLLFLFEEEEEEPLYDFIAEVALSLAPMPAVSPSLSSSSSESKSMVDSTGKLLVVPELEPEEVLLLDRMYLNLLKNLALFFAVSS
jgi:hypothetical protein